MPVAIRVVALLLLILAHGGRAQAPLDPERGELRFVVFGDFNGPYGALAYPAAVERTLRAIGEVWRPDLVLVPGDVVAGQLASLPDERFAAMWAAFDDAVAAPLRAYGVPYAIAIGNHDGSSLRRADGAFAFARERDAARAYWSQPMYEANLDYVDRSDFPFTYAFRVGELFVAVIDASSATVGPEQRAWLADVLSRRDASAAAARLVMGHLPLFGVSVGRDRAGEVVDDGDGLALHLVRLAVDTYVSGHHAAYYAGRRGALELLFAGGIGARPLVGSSAPPRSAVTVVDAWTAPWRVRYTTFDPSTMEVIPGGTLPASIDGTNGAVERSQRGLP